MDFLTEEKAFQDTLPCHDLFVLLVLFAKLLEFAFNKVQASRVQDWDHGRKGLEQLAVKRHLIALHPVCHTDKEWIVYLTQICTTLSVLV